MEQPMATVNQDMQYRYIYKWMNSSIGRLKLVATGDALAGVLWEHERHGRVRFGAGVEDNRNGVLVETERQIGEYLSGRREKFSLKLDLQGTDFQRSVWNALLTIPFGETRSYEQIARQIGKPTAVRAVGAANGRNPVSLVVPCHRVIAASGALTGFAGGLEIKAFLLTLEAKAYVRALEAGDPALLHAG
jgi:methylated-DNA-[protein]-cysteine S-methyltransferase